MRVFDNLAVKLASLGLAALLWFVIAGEKTSERGVSVPVELQNFPKDLELTGDTVNMVEVRLRASPGIIQQLGPGEVSAQIDLKGVREGEHIVHLTDSAIRVPFGVKVVKISPAILDLNFERTLSKRVPIRPRITGRPAAGHELSELSSDPAEVSIAGPKSRVQDVESAFTEPISIDGAARNVSDDVNLGLEDPVLRIQGSPRVHVLARIREQHEKRSLSLPLVLRDGTGQARPQSVEVTVSGPRALLERVGPQALEAYARVPKGGAGAAAVAVEIAPGFTGISVLGVLPAEVQVRPLVRGRKE